MIAPALDLFGNLLEEVDISRGLTCLRVANMNVRHGRAGITGPDGFIRDLIRGYW
jgi:hypothetical protein